MDKQIERLPGQLPLEFPEGDQPTAALKAWWSDVGESTTSLGEMMRMPTDVRPFVYEVRFDLLSLRDSVASVVLKGFGEDGGLISFHGAVGFVDAIRGIDGRMRAGKTKWQVDQYPPANYEERVALYQSGTVYRRR